MTHCCPKTHGLFLQKEERGVWSSGTWAGPGLAARRSQDFSLLFPVPPKPKGLPAPNTPASGAPSSLLHYPCSLWGLEVGCTIPAAPAPLCPSPHTPFQSRQALLASFALPIHPQAPTSAPCFRHIFSLPVLMSLIHLPLSKIHPLLPSLSHIETNKDAQTQK